MGEARGGRRDLPFPQGARVTQRPIFFKGLKACIFGKGLKGLHFSQGSMALQGLIKRLSTQRCKGQARTGNGRGAEYTVKAVSSN